MGKTPTPRKAPLRISENLINKEYIENGENFKFRYAQPGYAQK